MLVNLSFPQLPDILVTYSNRMSRLQEITSKPTSGPDAPALLVQKPQEHQELIGWWVQSSLKRQAVKASI